MSRFGICESGGNEFLARIIERANIQPEVKALVISTHTPGGTVDSTELLANTIRDSRKKVVGYVNGLCASAGVFALSQADEMVMENSVSAEIGSIGVLMVYVNQKKAMENEGYEVEIFRADGSEDKARLECLRAAKRKASRGNPAGSQRRPQSICRLRSKGTGGTA